MGAQRKRGDRSWLAATVCMGVAVDVTLNKYSAILPWYCVIGLWAIPAALFIVWFVKVERTDSWVKDQFLQSPVSYVLMFLILIPFGWGATSRMLARLNTKPATADRAKIITPQLQSPERELRPATPPQAIATPKIKKQDSPRQRDKPAITQAQPDPPSAVPASQPTYQQQCLGSACAQGPNSQATLNQYGPPKYSITEEQLSMIRDGMHGFEGKSILIRTGGGGAEDVDGFAAKLNQALHQCGVNASIDRDFEIIGAPAGISFEFNDSSQPIALALVQVLAKAQLVKIPARASRNGTGESPVIEITPYR